MKLRLIHKGLMLVSIPLCFEITIFGILIDLQNHAEKEEQRIQLNRKINNNVNQVLHNLMKLGRVQNTYSLRDLNKSSFKENLNEVFARFDELDALTRSDASLNSSVHTVRKALECARSDLDDAKKAIRNATSDELPGIIKLSRKQLDHDLFDAYTAGLLDLADRSLQGTDDVRSSRLREKITIVLKYALGLSVLMGIFGATMFSRHLVGRLHRLGNNAGRLARGEALKPMEEGGDEVGELEQSFHYAADLIFQAAKMRNEVASMITNELKTPLENIITFLKKLHQGTFGAVDEQGLMLLSLSEKESARMVALIDSVLDLDKIRQGNLKINFAPVDLAALLDRSADTVQLLADEKSIVIKREYRDEGLDVSGSAASRVDVIDKASDSVGRLGGSVIKGANSGVSGVSGDAFWLQQVAVNILSNAIKFSPVNTTVTIAIQPAPTEVVIRISDMGPGISKDERQLVFERFHRISSTSTGIAGSGLGLTISRELIELHHGSIDIDSEVGRGSTFNIRLPRSQQFAQKGRSGARNG